MRGMLLGLGMLASVVAGCDRGTNKADDPKAAEAEIRALLDRWSNAFRRRDLNGVMAIYAPGNETIAYDLVPPLEYRGTEAYRRDYADFFVQFSGPLELQVKDLHIHAGRDVAYSFGLERMGGTLTDGSHFETWVRFTEGYRRINGRWYAVHDHISVPADVATGKARLDLKP